MKKVHQCVMNYDRLKVKIFPSEILLNAINSILMLFFITRNLFSYNRFYEMLLFLTLFEEMVEEIFFSSNLSLSSINSFARYNILY